MRKECTERILHLDKLIFAYGGLVLGLCYCSSRLKKMTLPSKVVKTNAKIIILLC